MKPNRILVMLLSAIILAGSFLYLTETAFASSELQSPYPDRVHVHDQWFRVFVQVGTNPEEKIDTNWRPVFDYPETLGSGYTADEPSKISSELAHYLKTANMYDEKNNMYLLSASGAQEVSKGNHDVKGSEWIKNIPIRNTGSAAEILERVGVPVKERPGATKKEPYINHNEPPSSVVWDGNKFYYALSTSAIDGEYRGIKNLRRDNGAHRAFVNPAQAAKVGYGELKLHFPYNTMFTDLTPIVLGKIVAGETAYGHTNVVNLAPWPTVPANTKFRIYIQERGKDPQLVNGTQNLDLEPFKPKPVPFEFPVPHGEFKLILTVNMYWDGNGWRNEPLHTYNSFGEGGSRNFVALPESEYLRNKIEVSYLSDEPIRPGSGEEENDQPANLSVTSLEILTKDGSPASGTLEVNKSYKVRATFKSTFDFSGKARIRLYVKREKGYMDLQEESNTTFKPNGTVEKTWDTIGTTEKRTFIATISYRDTSGGWVEEPFEGQMEATYTDNKRELTVDGTDGPDEVLPKPGKLSYSLYYHPQRLTTVPIYEQRQILVYIQEWLELPFYPVEDNTQIRVRLVPTPTEEKLIGKGR